MDPTGRELGDFNGADAFGIPYGSYTRDFQYNDDDSGGLANGDPSGLKGMSIPSPPTGTYQVVATGTGSGPYTLTFTGVATDGTEQSSVQTGTASLGATVVYNLTYSSTPGAPLGITTGGAAVVLSPGTLPAFPAQVVNTQSSAQTIKLSNQEPPRWLFPVLVLQGISPKPTPVNPISRRIRVARSQSSSALPEVGFDPER